MERRLIGRNPTSKGAASPIARLVAFSCQRAWAVAALGLVLGAGALAYAASHFAMTTDTDQLISKALPWRQREAAFNRLFQPGGDQIVMVIDGATPELAEEAAQALAAKLASRPDLFHDVRRPDAGPFFERNGLLFESPAQVRSTLDQLVAAQPFLGPLAADPSLRGLMGSLSTALQGITAGQATLADLAGPITGLDHTMNQIRAGRPAYFSWRTLISGKPAEARELRHIVLADPVLDFSRLQPGADPSGYIRSTARRFGLDPAHGVRVRLTGPTPLQDEEFGTLAERAGLIAGLALGAIVIMLWMAVRSVRLIGAILLTTLIGLVVAAACGLLIFHRFNVISVAFIPLFVGLGIDFGIQFTVRFRAKHQVGTTTEQALIASGAGMGRSLTLAASAIACGFLAFAPTAYVGVSQLGVIAGVGMFIALALNLTVLPAFIRLLRPAAGSGPAPQPRLERLDGFILGHRKAVVGVGVGAALACAGPAPPAAFRFQSPSSEERQGGIGGHPARPDEGSRPVAQHPRSGRPIPHRRRCPGHATGRAVAGARRAHAGELRPRRPGRKAGRDRRCVDASGSDPPSHRHPAAARRRRGCRRLRQTAGDLRQAAGDATGATAQAARRLAASLDWLAAAAPAARARAAKVLMPGLATVLGQTRNALQAAPVTLDTLPAELRRDWLAPDGRARVSITPKGDSNDNAVLTRFIDAVVALAPDATGAPIDTREGGRTVAGAFAEAGLLSFIAITLLLLAVLRRVRDVAITMAPIVLTGLLTLGSCVVIGQPLNFANIIALPLLFGIGVAFHIYFVMAWRSGGRAPAAIEPDPGGVLQRPGHGHRLRQPVGLQPSGHRQHGQAADDLPGLDPGLGPALPAGPDGPPRADREAGGRRPS